MRKVDNLFITLLVLFFLVAGLATVGALAGPSHPMVQLYFYVSVGVGAIVMIVVELRIWYLLSDK